MTLEDIMSLHGDPAAMREAIIAYGKEWRAVGVAAEREACAMICDSEAAEWSSRSGVLASKECAKTIRARAQEE